MSGTSWAVAVLGSANVDVVLTVSAIPAPGETVLASSRAMGPGGKGANQAAAAARAGARTCFIGSVGADAAADLLLAELAASGVVPQVRRAAQATGTAYVVVDPAGENAIVVDAGANAELTGLTDAELAAIGDAAVLLCQLEVPVETVAAALQHARARGVLGVLNAAPAQQLPAGLVALVDVLIVNEHEARTMAGCADLDEAVAALLDRVPALVVTLGAEGALVAERGGSTSRVPGIPARRVVDTTGAGDTFCGAYAASRASGASPVGAVEVGCAAASLSVEQAGAGRSAPTLTQIHERLAAARASRQ